MILKVGQSAQVKLLLAKQKIQVTQTHTADPITCWLFDDSKEQVGHNLHCQSDTKKTLTLQAHWNFQLFRLYPLPSYKIRVWLELMYQLKNIIRITNMIRDYNLSSSYIAKQKNTYCICKMNCRNEENNQFHINIAQLPWCLYLAEHIMT